MGSAQCLFDLFGGFPYEIFGRIQLVNEVVKQGFFLGEIFIIPPVKKIRPQNSFYASFPPKNFIRVTNGLQERKGL